VGNFSELAKQRRESDRDVFYLVRPDSVWCFHDPMSPEMSISFISDRDLAKAQVDFEAEGFSWTMFTNRHNIVTLIVVSRSP